METVSSTSKGIDRISNLPDEVLHNILSRLFIFDVVQLSVLSKRWKNIWTTMPYLHFDVGSFYSQRPHLPINSPETHQKFKDFISWVLISKSATKLVRFVLSCATMFDKCTLLRWIHTLARRNIQEFVLEFYPREPFELPYCLARCESLQVVKLHMSFHILKLPNHFGFRQLKLLHLEEVVLSDEHLTNCLFSKCHLLETVFLKDCSLGDLTLLDIASTSLVYITLRNDNYEWKTYLKCEVRISCPNLKFLKYKAPVPKDIIVMDLSSIEVVGIFFTLSFSAEKTGLLVHKMTNEVASTSVLKLCWSSISGLHEVAHEARLSRVSFYKLKSLKLIVRVDKDFMQVVILLLKYSPNLEVLKLCSNEIGDQREEWQLHDPDENIACLESHLKSIQLSGFKGSESKMQLLSFFLKNALVLEKLIIVWDYNADTSEEVVFKCSRTTSVVDVILRFSRPKPKPRHWYT